MNTMVDTRVLVKIGKAVAEAPFMVPDTYDHDNQINRFLRKILEQVEKIKYLDPNLNSENFSRVRDKLVPGERYLAKLLPLNSLAENEQCLDFLHKDGSLRVGPQGLTLAKELLPENFFPLDKWVATVLKDDEAFFNGTDHLTMMLRKYPGKFHYELVPAEGQWDIVHCLFAIYKLK